jgi:phosphatidylinositol dimannoside acyltransferase
MSTQQSPESATNQGADVSRFGVFGDLPTRAMLWLIGAFPKMPFFIELSLLYFFTAVVFLFAHSQRRAIRANLHAITPDLSLAEGLLGAFQVFVNFGRTYIDGLRARLGQEVVTWEIEGLNIFEEIREMRGGAILLTTHTGNYDLAAALFSPKFGRDLHTVRAPERSTHLQEIRRRELKEDLDRYHHFKVHYNTSQSMLGVELARLLSEGELVAIQCDRVFGDVAAIEVPIHRHHSIRIPKGPMVLAVIARCPCYPMHVIRVRHRHYRILFQKPLEVSAYRAREADFARAWVLQLMLFLETHALEWFVFEEAFIPPPASPRHS